MYVQSYLNAIMNGYILNGKPVPTYDEIFKTKTPENEQYVDNAILKEMWLDYRAVWNKQKRGEQVAGDR